MGVAPHDEGEKSTGGDGAASALDEASEGGEEGEEGPLAERHEVLEPIAEDGEGEEEGACQEEGLAGGKEHEMLLDEGRREDGGD